MAKDYKDSPSPHDDSRLSHPLLLGTIIGLLLGIVISLTVALWLNRLSNPFVDKEKKIEPVPKISAAQPPPPADVAKAAEKAAKGAPDRSDKADKAEKPARTSERPRFEFYQILPGDKEVIEKEAKAVAKAPAGSVKPGSSPSTPKPHSGEIYWLQAGAFSEEREADNLKAKIALTGLEAAVRPVAIPNRGTMYRVRLGPYQSVDDATRNKTTLSQNGVAAAIIRTTDEAKTP